jgi:arylsulfatase
VFARRFRVFALACLLPFALACPAPPERPPHVILIDIESLRADHVSHLGYTSDTARALDGFRDEAALFSQATAPSSDSVSSSASLLTGLAPQRHGALGADPRIDDAVETLAERLAAAGWHTAALSHHPNLSRERGFAQGFARFDGASGRPIAAPDAGDMVNWLREWLATEPPSPFFLYLHPMNLHGPYRVPSERTTVLLGREPDPAFRYDGRLMRAVMGRGAPAIRNRISPRQRQSLVEQYDTAARYTLDRVSEMLLLLEHSGALANAIVVITSNHGEELFDRGGFGHGTTLNREQIHVPLYVKPSWGTAIRSIDAPVSTLDVAPTILDWLALPKEGLDGVSLAGPLVGEPVSERTFTYALDAPKRRARAFGIARERYHLIDVQQRYDTTQPVTQLYDWLPRCAPEAGPSCGAARSASHSRGRSASSRRRRPSALRPPPGTRSATRGDPAPARWPRRSSDRRRERRQ